MPVVPLTETQIVAGLRSPYKLGAAQFTFSIPTASSFWETTSGNYTGTNLQPFQGYSILSAGEATAFRAAIAAWDRLIAPNFTEVLDDGTSHGEIRVGFTSNQMDAQTAAYAFQGSNQTPTSIVGDIWINSSSAGQSFDLGTDNYITLLHEIGHTLGLKHSFEPTVIPAPYEDQRYTVMSYTIATPVFARGFAPTQGGGLSTTSTRIIVTTPMVLDIVAVQNAYGADTTTASGNDTYAFALNDTRIQTIYDAGGTDTWDLSAVARNNIVDLRPGSYSSIGYWTIAEQTAYWQAQYPGFNNFIANQMNSQPWYEWKDNVGIAFTTTIENVIGGSGNDNITGNDADNLINLKLGGNDTVSAGLGNDGIYFGAAFTAADVVDGGAGTLDQVALQGNYSGGVTLAATSLANVEQIVLMTGSDTSYGDTANNFYSYNLVLNDGNVAAGQVLSFSANTLRSGENFTLNAAAETDGRIVTYGGAGIDTISGGQQNDGFFFGNGLWGSNDSVNGRGGNFDQLAIQGAYTGANAITLLSANFANIESLVLLSASDLRFGSGGTAYSYDVTLTDSAVVNSSATLAVSANTLTATETLTLNASAETASAYTVFSGAGADTIRTGGGNDTIFGGGGGDQLTGGAGNDIFAYSAISDSTIASTDAINDFTTGDRVDLSRLDANTVLAGSQQFTFTTSQVLTVGQVHVVSNGGTSYTVEGEVDGVPGVDFRIFVNSDHALTISDFTGVSAGPGGSMPSNDVPSTQPQVVTVVDAHIGIAAPADVVLAAPEPLVAALSMDHFAGSAPGAPAEVSIANFAFSPFGGDLPAAHDAALYMAPLATLLEPAVPVI